MKLLCLFAVCILLHIITPSNSAHCQCNCCLKEPDNDDCLVEVVGNVNVNICPEDPNGCKQSCQVQFPTQCNQNQSVAESECVSDSTTPVIPTTTPVINGPFECTCSCCSAGQCEPQYQGDVIVDNCNLCTKQCGEKYPSQCGRNTTIESNKCRSPTSTPPNNTYRINSNIFLFLFISTKVFFL
jgi:hypothetical protein